jgi:Family of unknown function (DUF6521)
MHNPAFLGEILFRFCKAYSAVGGQPVPYALLFVALPVVLYKDLRVTVRPLSYSLLHVWVSNNPVIRLRLPTLARRLVPATREAAMLLLASGRLRLSGGEVTAVQLRRGRRGKVEPSSGSIHECLTKAETLGRWCGRALNQSQIFLLLGVSL